MSQETVRPMAAAGEETGGKEFVGDYKEIRVAEGRRYNPGNSSPLGSGKAGNSSPAARKQ